MERNPKTQKLVYTKKQTLKNKHIDRKNRRAKKKTHSTFLRPETKKRAHNTTKKAERKIKYIHGRADEF